MFCRNCGEDIPVDSVFCPNCGKNLLASGARVRGTAKEYDDDIAQDRPDDLEDEGGAEDDQPAAEYGRARPGIDWSVWERIGLGRLFWIMGLVFATVGFVVGLSSNPIRAVSWILFGIALIIAARSAPKPAAHVNQPPDQEEAID